MNYKKHRPIYYCTITTHYEIKKERRLKAKQKQALGKYITKEYKTKVDIVYTPKLLGLNNDEELKRRLKKKRSELPEEFNIIGFKLITILGRTE